MLSKERFFRAIVANIIIAVVLIMVAATTLSFEIQNVFKSGSTDVVYRGDTEKKNVAIMINVYWGTEYLEPMLNTFKEKGAHATFFVGGSWVAENNDYLKLLQLEGHEIGNHGYWHKDHDKISRARNHDEIYITEKLVESIIGVKTSLFAPPSGAFNKTTVEVAKSLGYKTIMWSKDTIDWRDQDTGLLYTRATKNLSGGDLILMHPTAATAKILPKIIDTMIEQGYNVTTVSNTL